VEKEQLKSEWSGVTRGGGKGNLQIRIVREWKKEIRDQRQKKQQKTLRRGLFGGLDDTKVVGVHPLKG